MLAQELLRNYHRVDTTPRSTIKVDILKAFDTVDWRFLFALLTALGFPPRFVDWIKECVTTPRFSVNINGELAGFFGSSRGLRQGDPLSSYLFVIIMDALSMLIAKRVEESSRDGQPFDYHWRCSKNKITHLCFADDLMLFCGKSARSINTLHSSLQEFSILSGLTPNKDKSCIFLAGNNQSYNSLVLQVFQFPCSTLPLRYLGVPLITTKLSYANCHMLIDGITSRIRNWKAKLLTFAGRLQLIQSVLCSVQSYWNGLFILPKKVIKQVEQILRRFLWKGPNLEKEE